METRELLGGREEKSIFPKRSHDFLQHLKIEIGVSEADLLSIHTRKRSMVMQRTVSVKRGPPLRPPPPPPWKAATETEPVVT